jgi:hypothetical protein
MSQVLPIVAANDIEKNRSWEGISTPHDLAMYMSRVLAVDPSAVERIQEVVYSDVQPTGEDSSKIWIKTSYPAAIGLPVGGEYEVIYQYGPNVPILWITAAVPSYMRKLNSTELTDYGLTDPPNGVAKWVIFEI